MGNQVLRRTVDRLFLDLAVGIQVEKEFFNALQIFLLVIKLIRRGSVQLRGPH